MRPFAAVIAIAVIAAAGWGVWHYVRPDGATPAGGGAPPGARGGGPPGGIAVPVEASAARKGRLTRGVLAVGTLRSEQSIVVRPEIDGRIARIHFREGQKVEKGRRLVTLDDSIARAEVAQARAALALSKANYQRASDLLARGVGTVRTRDEALAKLKSDEAELALAEARLEKTVILAPFEGIIGLRKVDLGDFVNAGQDIANLEDVDPMKVDFRVPEIYLGAVAVGQKISVTVDAWPDRSFDGEAYAIDPVIDDKGRSIVLRARIGNTDGVLRPGLFVRVRLILTVRTDAILVPEEALIPVGADQFIYRVVDGKAVWTRVEIGERQQAEVEIRDGLEAGETVVTAGQLKLHDGVPVRIAPRGGRAP